MMKNLPNIFGDPSANRWWLGKDF